MGNSSYNRAYHHIIFMFARMKEHIFFYLFNLYFTIYPAGHLVNFFNFIVK